VLEALLKPREQLASSGGGGEGEDADSKEQPGGWLRHCAWRGSKAEGVNGEWSDVDGIVRIEDVDVVGAVVVDVGEAGSYGAGEGDEIAECGASKNF
jgi:hypothetical protein